MTLRQSILKLILAAGLLAPLSALGTTVVLTPAANNFYNTGFNGTTLAGDNQLDTHYVVTNYLTGQTYQANPLANGWVADTSSSQWITVSPTTTIAPSVTYDYQLTLTNIPVGELVTIRGFVAADDNATISANGSGAYFSNYAPNVVAGNYDSFTPFTGVVFVSGPNNELTITVDNNGGGPSGLDLQLIGSYAPLTSSSGLFLTPPPGLTQNQVAVLNNINHINAGPVNNACFTNLTISLLSSGPSALDQLSPEKLGVFSSIAFNDASFMSQQIDDYLAHRRNAQGNLEVNPTHIDTSGLTINDPSMDPVLAQVKSRLLAWNPAPAAGLVSDTQGPLLVSAPPPASDDPANNWNFFLSGDVILGQDFSQPELDHTDYTTSSVEIGWDYQIGEHFLVGTLLNYGHTDTALDGQGSSATIDSYSPGLFASYAQGGWFANALGVFSHNAYTEERHVGFGTFNETATGAPEGSQELGDIDGGYEFHIKHWTFGPTAGLQYVHLNVNPFTEVGGCSSDLAVKNEATDSLRSRFGGRISYALFDHADQVTFTPYLDASWQHEYWGGSRCITSSFSEMNGGDFTVSTPTTSRDSALVAVGLDADLNSTITLFSDYAVQAGENDYFGQSVQAGMKIAF